VAIDVVTVALIAVAFGFLIPHRAPRASGTTWDAGGWVTYAVAAVATPFRRRFPRATLALVLLAALAALYLRAGGGAVAYVAMALYSVAAVSSRRAALIIVGLVASAVLAATIIGGGDQALVRGGFVVMVGAAPDMEVLGEAADGAQAVAMVRQHHPDVVLMDIRMPVLDGIEATRAITTDPDTAAARVLILTTFDLDDYVYRALRGRRQRVPAQGHRPRGTSRRDPHPGRRRRPAGPGHHPPPDPRIRQPARARRILLTQAARPPVGPGAGGAGRSGRRLVERRDRRAPAHLRSHRQNARQPPADETGRPRPRPAGHDRLRDQARHPRLSMPTA